MVTLEPGEGSSPSRQWAVAITQSPSSVTAQQGAAVLGWRGLWLGLWCVGQ